MFRFVEILTGLADVTIGGRGHPKVFETAWVGIRVILCALTVALLD